MVIIKLIILGLFFQSFLGIQAFAIQFNQGYQTMQTMQTMQSVKGKFEVSMSPQQDTEFSVGRMTIDKVYSGGIVGTGKGQMLSHMSDVKGSAGYVAIEKFEGLVSGKKGSFVLMHRGSMDKGDSSLNITIIADSGTQELSGIRGNMTIEVVDGQHLYQLDYVIK